MILACENQKKAVKSAQSGSSSVVERLLAKEEVAGSNPVFRSSEFLARGGVAKRLRQGSAKPPCGGSNPPAAFSNYRSPGRGGGMVDAADLKSASCKGVWVRVPPSAVSQVVSNFLKSRREGLSPQSIGFYQGYLKLADMVIGFHITGQDISHS